MLRFAVETFTWRVLEHLQSSPMCQSSGLGYLPSKFPCLGYLPPLLPYQEIFWYYNKAKRCCRVWAGDVVPLCREIRAWVTAPGFASKSLQLSSPQSMLRALCNTLNVFGDASQPSQAGSPLALHPPLSNTTKMQLSFCTEGFLWSIQT